MQIYVMCISTIWRILIVFNSKTCCEFSFDLFIYLGFNITFNTVQGTSRRVVLWAEETSTYSWCQGSVL